MSTPPIPLTSANTSSLSITSSPFQNRSTTSKSLSSRLYDALWRLQYPLLASWVFIALEPWEKLLVATVLVAMTVVVGGLAVKLLELVGGLGWFVGGLRGER